MKHLRGLLFVTIIVIAGLQLTGCSKMPTAPTADVARGQEDGIGLDQVAGVQEMPFDDFTIIKTWKTSKKIRYNRGGWIGKRNKAYLYIPPKSMSSGRDTRISADVSLTSDGRILCDFGPDGLAFEPNATMVIHYRDINSADVTLQRWTGSGWDEISSSDDSNPRYRWDRNKKVVTFDIEHFSIYLITRD